MLAQKRDIVKLIVTINTIDSVYRYHRLSRPCRISRTESFSRAAAADACADDP